MPSERRCARSGATKPSTARSGCQWLRLTACPTETRTLRCLMVDHSTKMEEDVEDEVPEVSHLSMTPFHCSFSPDSTTWVFLSCRLKYKVLHISYGCQGLSSAVVKELFFRLRMGTGLSTLCYQIVSCCCCTSFLWLLIGHLFLVAVVLLYEYW